MRYIKFEELTTLQKAVIEQLGHELVEVNDEEVRDQLSDIANHGANAGWSGFTYYIDTLDFFDKNRTAIIESLAELSDEIGESVIDIIRGFGCLNNDNETHNEIDAVVMSLPTPDDQTQVKNALAWYALEEVARQLSDD